MISLNNRKKPMPTTVVVTTLWLLLPLIGGRSGSGGGGSVFVKAQKNNKGEGKETTTTTDVPLVLLDEDEGNNNNASSTKLSLAASNPFRMVIRPTMFELDFVALSIVEEAMATAILLSTDSASLVDVNINVNQMNWLSPSSSSKAGENDNNNNEHELVDGTINALGVEDIPTTVLKFFAVGTFLVEVPAGTTTDPGSLAAVKALDEIVENAFSLENYGAFVELMRNSGDPLLEGVQDAVAIRTNANPTVPLDPSGTNSGVGDDDNSARGRDGDQNLDLLDVVLICVSASIFLGIIFMIWQHTRDRTYMENERIRSLNSYSRRHNHNRHETSSTYSPRNTTSDDDDSRPDKAASIAGSARSSSESSRISVVRNHHHHNQSHHHEEQPSHTSSSIFTTNTTTDGGAGGGDPQSFITNFNLPPSTMDINTHLNSRKGRYSSKVRISIESIHNCDSRSLPTPSSSSRKLAGGGVLDIGISASSEQSISDEKSECKSTGALSFTGLSTALSNVANAGAAAGNTDFGPINWFRKSSSLRGLSMANSNDPSSNIEVPLDDDDEEDHKEEAADHGVSPTSKNSTTSSSSSSSDSNWSAESDVFQIGNVKANVISAGSIANGSDTVSKASSVVTEWMKTIRVVASADSNSVGSDMSHHKGSSSEQSSTAANSSTEAPTVDDDDDEAEDIVSLEHSMANSNSMMSGYGGDSSTMEF